MGTDSWVAQGYNGLYWFHCGALACLPLDVLPTERLSEPGLLWPSPGTGRTYTHKHTHTQNHSHIHIHIRTLAYIQTHSHIVPHTSCLYTCLWWFQLVSDLWQFFMLVLQVVLP